MRSPASNLAASTPHGPDKINFLYLWRVCVDASYIAKDVPESIVSIQSIHFCDPESLIIIACSPVITQKVFACILIVLSYLVFFAVNLHTGQWSVSKSSLFDVYILFFDGWITITLYTFDCHHEFHTHPACFTVLKPFFIQLCWCNPHSQSKFKTTNGTAALMDMSHIATGDISCMHLRISMLMFAFHHAWFYFSEL